MKVFGAFIPKRNLLSEVNDLSAAHVGSRVPVLFMRINVAKEVVHLCRILAVEGRRVKCVFPRNESAEGNGSISSKDREQSGGGGGVVG